MKKLRIIMQVVMMYIVPSALYAQNYIYKIQTVKEKFFGDSIWVKKDRLCIGRNGNGNCFVIDEVVDYYTPESKKKIFTYDQLPFNTCGISAQTAFTQKKGKFLFRNFLFLDNTLEKGLSDHVSIQVGNTIFSANNRRSLFTPFTALKGSLPIIKNKISIGARTSVQKSSSYDYSDKKVRNGIIIAYSAILTIGSQYNFFNLNYTLENYQNIGKVSRFTIGVKCRLNYYFSSLMEYSAIDNIFHHMLMGFRHDLRRVGICYGIIISERTSRIPMPYFGVHFQF